MTPAHIIFLCFVLSCLANGLLMYWVCKKVEKEVGDE